ncbi:MAG TPA: type II toxin-antitoxin system prevent-host-death family antitoxin [Stellaceae bacterium]
MVTGNLAQAKAPLSELLDQVEGGESIAITRHGKPVANLSTEVGWIGLNRNRVSCRPRASTGASRIKPR